MFQVLFQVPVQVQVYAQEMLQVHVKFQVLIQDEFQVALQASFCMYSLNPPSTNQAPTTEKRQHIFESDNTGSPRFFVHFFASTFEENEDLFLPIDTTVDTILDIVLRPSSHSSS